MMDKHKTVSLSDQIFERLEKDILNGKYEHGQIVTEMQLAADMGVSRTPIREAVAMLEQEDLVINDSRGIEILGITEKDIADMFCVRSALEPLVAQACAAVATDEQIAEMEKVLDMQEFFLSKSNASEIRACDSSFHEMLYEYADSRVLWRILSPMHRKLQKYRQVSVSDPSAAHLSVQEHRTILDAIKAHDEEKAFAAMNEHIQNAVKRIKRKLD